MVNRLTPSNIKRTANNLMDEWEKSLADPESAFNKENDFVLACSAAAAEAAVFSGQSQRYGGGYQGHLP